MWRIERVRFLHHTCSFEKRDVLISCSCRSSSFHSSPAFLSKTWKTSSNPASGKQQVICGCFVRKKTTWSEGLLSFPLKRLNSGNNNPFLQSSWHRTSRKPVMTTYVLQTEGGNKLPLLSLFLCNQFLLLHEREPWRDYKMRGNTTRKRNISRIITVFPVNEERTWTFSWRRRLPKKANRHSFYSSKRLSCNLFQSTLRNYIQQKRPCFQHEYEMHKMQNQGEEAQILARLAHTNLKEPPTSEWKIMIFCDDKWWGKKKGFQWKTATVLLSCLPQSCL